jgi:hypothetical protein
VRPTSFCSTVKKQRANIVHGFSYAGLVELLAHDFLYGELAKASGRRILAATGCLFLGLFVMT